MGGTAKLFIIGGSHAKRLYLLMKQNENLTRKYQIINFAKPGATAENVIMPDIAKITDKDILFVQLFGNDLFDRGSVVRFSQRNNRKFHLKRFSPLRKDKYKQLFGQFKEKLKEVKGKIYILDNPYRYICQCKAHQYPGLIKVQSQFNAALHSTFIAEENVKVLSHLSLLNLGKKSRVAYRYRRIFCDNIHLKRQQYKKLIGAWVNRHGVC